MQITPTPADDARRSLHLFAYDISNNRRRYRALKCLTPWRLNGQYSVHETHLLPHQARTLTTELLDILHPRRDHLLTCRLSQRGSGPIRVLARPRHRTALTQHHNPTVPWIHLPTLMAQEGDDFDLALAPAALAQLRGPIRIGDV